MVAIWLEDQKIPSKDEISTSQGNMVNKDVNKKSLYSLSETYLFETVI